MKHLLKYVYLPLFLAFFVYETNLLLAAKFFLNVSGLLILFCCLWERVRNASILSRREALVFYNRYGIEGGGERERGEERPRVWEEEWSKSWSFAIGVPMFLHRNAAEICL
jgi:hypothetical protein